MKEGTRMDARVCEKHYARRRATQRKQGRGGANLANNVTYHLGMPWVRFLVFCASNVKTKGAQKKCANIVKQNLQDQCQAWQIS